VRTVALTALALVSFAARSEASCIDVVSTCFCPMPINQVGVVVTEGIDGGLATLRVESGNAGLEPDAGLTLPATSERIGDRWLLLGDVRRPVDAQGNVTCEYFPSKPIPVGTAANAAVSPDCATQVAAFGIVQPPCNDVRGCSAAPLAVFPLLAALWLLRRRTS
jgi:hypothetical protein